VLFLTATGYKYMEALETLTCHTPNGSITPTAI